jgi:L-methionine (R)-S-oxide reductase
MEPDYELLSRQAEALLGEEPDPIANAANFAAFVYTQVPDLNWAGFYFPTASGDLVLGPFSGMPACSRLPYGRGVCGAAYTSKALQVVDDVHAFADHIVCDTASASEIVIPLLDGEQCIGVFDIDSPRKARFARADRDGIERLVDAFMSTLRRSGARIPTPAS